MLLLQQHQPGCGDLQVLTAGGAAAAVSACWLQVCASHGLACWPLLPWWWRCTGWMQQQHVHHLDLHQHQHHLLLLLLLLLRVCHGDNHWYQQQST